MVIQYTFKISLEAARVNANLKQKEAAEALGIGVSTLRSYEKGHTVPQWDVVIRMEELYNIPASNIFFGPRLALSDEAG